MPGLTPQAALRVAIACLTFADCHAYGLNVEAEHSPKNIDVYHCHFLNIGNLRLRGENDAVVDRGLVLAEVLDDIDARRRDVHPDIGASEYVNR